MQKLSPAGIAKYFPPYLLSVLPAASFFPVCNFLANKMKILYETKQFFRKENA